jgi:Ni,Fe-hydrogenase maturation factor
MKTVTIEREALEFLTRHALDFSDYIDVKELQDRTAVRHIDTAIQALNLQETLEEESRAVIQKASAAYRAAKAEVEKEKEAANA